MLLSGKYPIFPCIKIYINISDHRHIYQIPGRMENEIQIINFDKETYVVKIEWSCAWINGEKKYVEKPTNWCRIILLKEANNLVKETTIQYNANFNFIYGKLAAVFSLHQKELDFCIKNSKIINNVSQKSVFHVPPTYSSLTNNQNITSVTSLKIKNVTLK